MPKKKELLKPREKSYDNNLCIICHQDNKLFITIKGLTFGQSRT